MGRITDVKKKRKEKKVIKVKKEVNAHVKAIQSIPKLSTRFVSVCVCYARDGSSQDRREGQGS